MSKYHCERGDTLMVAIDWNKITEPELKDINYIVNAFGRYLKKECSYSSEEARFAKDIIDDPYAYHGVQKQYISTQTVCGKEYEIYFCSINDCEVEKYFTFYMLIDVNTISGAYDKLRSYVFADKKYILV